MRRKIVRIDEDKCDGCGLCAEACAEGAIRIEDGKARLVSDSYCDGLGACLGECPRGAITIEEREAEAFDEVAVKAHQAQAGESWKPPAAASAPAPLPCGCPGTAVRTFEAKATPAGGREGTPGEVPSSLGQWPVQLKLVPPMAPYLQGADLLVCADCVAYAVGDFHARYLAGRAIVIACPKLDDLEYYRAKMDAILSVANPRSITVLRMQVPCCGGIAHLAHDARDRVAPSTPLKIITIGLQGDVIDEVEVPPRAEPVAREKERAG